MNNTDSLRDKARALLTMCIQAYGMGKTLDIFNGAIDGYIAENLRRGTDEVAKQFLTDKKRKLMGLI